MMSRQTPDLRRRCPDADDDVAQASMLPNDRYHDDDDNGRRQRDGIASAATTSTTTLLDQQTTPTDGTIQKTTAAMVHSVRRLVHWDELPLWQRDNQYILTGYRPMSGSVRTSFSSLAYWHNETVNIYTHLLPSLAVLPAALSLTRALAARYASATRADTLAFACFFAGAATCLTLSATYHTLSNHSPRVARVGNALDYLGIVGLITGSFVPSVYYAFYCHRALQLLYWGMICSLAAGCATVSVFNRFRSPEWRPFRAGMFVAMGLSAVFPVFHGLAIFGVAQMQLQIGLFWLVLQGALYILGAYLYAIRVPEKWYPGRFDLLGSSHQIFHVLVVLAALSHLRGLLQAFDYRHSGLAEPCAA